MTSFRLASAAFIMLSLGIVFNLVSSKGLTSHSAAVIRAADVSLEAAIRHDEFLTHDLYYLPALLRKVARGGTILVPDLQLLDQHVQPAAIRQIADMKVEIIEYDAIVDPRLATNTAFEEWQDVYKRRESDERSEFRLVVARGSAMPTLVFFETTHGIAFVDQTTLEKPVER